MFAVTGNRKPHLTTWVLSGELCQFAGTTIQKSVQPKPYDIDLLNRGGFVRKPQNENTPGGGPSGPDLAIA